MQCIYYNLKHWVHNHNTNHGENIQNGFILVKSRHSGQQQRHCSKRRYPLYNIKPDRYII